MAHGGKRPGAGRKAQPKPEPIADKGAAARLIELVNGPRPHVTDLTCRCEGCSWWDLANAQDARVRLDTRKYLYDKRDGKAVQTVNHVHDKPIQVDVPGLQSLADAMREGRARVQALKKK